MRRSVATTVPGDNRKPLEAIAKPTQILDEKGVSLPVTYEPSHDTVCAMSVVVG